MSGPATEFARETPRVRSAESIREGDVLHYYHGELEADAEKVRLFTLAPEITADAVHDAFTRVAGGWHNPSTHPNVVTVYDRDTAPRPWLAVELVDGRPLDAVQADLSIHQVRTIASDAAEALRNAALYNTTHLALRPESVWITELSDGIEAVVDDWGLERACRVAAGKDSLTPFTAPELLDEPTGGDERTDVYGLGAVTYYALTGYTPSTGRSSVSDERRLEAAIREDDITPPSELVAGLSGAVDDVLLTALARDPNDRYNSAYAFQSAITDVLPAENGTAAPGSGGPTAATDTVDDTPSQRVEQTAERDEPPRPGDSDPRDEGGGGGVVTTRRAALALVGGGLVGGGGLFLLENDSGDGTESTDVEWTFQTGDWVYSSPTVSDGTVYVGSDDDSLYALAAATGEREWATPTGDNVESSPAVVDGTVYVGSDDGTVYAVDAASGDPEWDVRVGGSVESSPAVVDGTVYVGTDSGAIYALDTADGSSEWNIQTDRPVQSSPAVTADSVYVGTDAGIVYALATSTGGNQWTAETGGQVDSSPAVVDGAVYLGSLDGNVYAFDAATGDEQWRFETGNPVQSSPAVVDGTVYIGSGDGNVYALATADGSRQWQFQTGDPVNSSPAVVGGTVYVGSSDDSVYALDAASGDEQWTYQTGDNVDSSPAVVDGTVYVGSNDGTVYALPADTSGGTDSDWPMFTYDSANTGHPGG